MTLSVRELLSFCLLSTRIVVSKLYIALQQRALAPTWSASVRPTRTNEYGPPSPAYSTRTATRSKLFTHRQATHQKCSFVQAHAECAWADSSRENTAVDGRRKRKGERKRMRGKRN